MSTAGYAQVDGRAERTNQSVENVTVLRALVDYNQADWDSKLFAVEEFAINSHANATSSMNAAGSSPLTERSWTHNL